MADESLTPTRRVLHVSIGPLPPGQLDPMFQSADWQEIGFEIDRAAAPGIVGNVMAMPKLASDSFDAVQAKHQLQRLFTYQVPLALAEFHRVLKPDGVLLVIVPDLQKIAYQAAAGRLEDPLESSPLGSLLPIDLFFGDRERIAQGDISAVHRTGFSAAMLRKKIVEAGFERVEVMNSDNGFKMRAVAYKK